MILGPGDRVRVETTADDGFPVVRYGFVGALATTDDVVVVMLDGELGGNLIDQHHVQPVCITNVELCLAGDDLMSDPDLRRGLVALWHAEADSAGLDVDSLHPLGDGWCDETGSWSLAELLAGGENYVVRAFHLPGEPDTVRVRAGHPSQWRP